MRKLLQVIRPSLLSCGIAAVLYISAPARPAAAIKPNGIFLEAQRCRVNKTVDFGCFRQKLGKFEQFVLNDEASWVQKEIVAESLAKTYDALHVTSGAEQAVRAKVRINDKALQALDTSERGQIDDCRDEANPDGCLKDRYCFKEAYIKIKNVLVTNQPELFEPEIKWFDRGIRTDC